MFKPYCNVFEFLPTFVRKANDTVRVLSNISKFPYTSYSFSRAAIKGNPIKPPHLIKQIVLLELVGFS
jgi:hypothetical protein